MEQRTIVHLDLDTFFVSCERKINSKLNGIPLIVGGTSGRGVVSACSYEARTFGVRSAMPMHYALKLCPQAKVVKGDMELYSQHSKLVTDVIADSSPIFEKASIDEFYLDVSGMDKFFGCYKWTTELSQRIINESGLPISFGLSVNKTVAKIATGEAKPLGKIEINSKAVQSFLNPLSIKKIPQVGNKTYYTLARIGIQKIQTLSEIPIDYLKQLLGKNGEDLWMKANGIDNSPLKPFRDKKSISAERTFLTDTFDLVKLRTELSAMVEKLAFELRTEQWLTACISVKIRYNNFDTEMKQRKISLTANDNILLNTVNQLFTEVYSRRMMLRLIGVKFSNLSRGFNQIDLFQDTERDIALHQAMDNIRNRFGASYIQRATSFKNAKK